MQQYLQSIRLMEERLAALRERLRDIGPSLVAFSGGVDSTFLLRIAHDVLGGEVLAVTAVSPSLAPGQPAARRAARAARPWQHCRTSK